MHARTKGPDARPQDIDGRVELTVSAELTGHYSRESRQRAGPRTGVIEEHVDEKASVTMAGASQWSVKSQAGFEDVFFQVEPGKFTTSTSGQGRFNETKTHSDLCFAGVDSPRQERWSTDSHDMMWTLSSGSPAPPGADAASALNHLAVTRDTADPDRGAYLLGLSIPTASPAVAGQETQTGRLCGETTPQNSNLTDTPVGDGGAFTIVTNTLNLAMQDAAFTADLAGTFDRHTRGFSVTRHSVFNFAPKDDVFDNVEAADDVGIRSREHREGVLDLTYTVTYYVESDVDAVIEPEAEYGKWTPEASDSAYEPRPLEVHVRLHKKGAPNASAIATARFRFELVGTSQEPGSCMNAPKRTDPDFTVSTATEPFDLEFGAKHNRALNISDRGQRADTTGGLSEATVLINPADWGGYARLKVTAILKDGTEIVAHQAGHPDRLELRVPIDDNGNHVADGWEKWQDILDRKLPANWNEADDPAGQLASGDGISLYEKYRGFDVGVWHERLNATKKYLFLFDEDGLYTQTFAKPETAGLDFATLSDLEIRVISESQWTGTGPASAGRRIINFNHGTGHVVDQHAVHLRVGSLPPGTTGLAEDDGRFVFGPPRATLRATINTDGIFGVVASLALTAACTLPRTGGPVPAPACFGDAVSSAFLGEHWAEIEVALLKYTARTIAHELGHAVGVQHHDGTEDGDHACVMRYLNVLRDCGVVDPTDPVQLKCRSPWPSKLVGPDPRSYAHMGCFQQIVVNDAKYK